MPHFAIISRYWRMQQPAWRCAQSDAARRKTKTARILTSGHTFCGEEQFHTGKRMLGRCLGSSNSASILSRWELAVHANQAILWWLMAILELSERLEECRLYLSELSSLIIYKEANLITQADAISQFTSLENMTAWRTMKCRKFTKAGRN